MNYIDGLGTLSNAIILEAQFNFFVSCYINNQSYKLICCLDVEREVIRRCVAGL